MPSLQSLQAYAELHALSPLRGSISPLWKPRRKISTRNILIFAAPGAEACGQLRRTKFVCGRLRNACGSSVGKGTTRLVSVGKGFVSGHGEQNSDPRTRTVENATGRGNFDQPRSSNAPINIRPHYPPYGTLVGIIRDLHVNFDPRGGAFDLSPHNLL